MCDQGASRRDRSMRDERRAIWHPDPIKEGQLIAGIDAWENRLARYLQVKREDAMSVTDRLMALEDRCPVHIQRHLAVLEAQGQIEDSGDKAYAQHKAAIEHWFLNQKRWAKSAETSTPLPRSPRRTSQRSHRRSPNSQRRTGLATSSSRPTP